MIKEILEKIFGKEKKCICGHYRDKHHPIAERCLIADCDCGDYEELE